MWDLGDFKRMSPRECQEALSNLTPYERKYAPAQRRIFAQLTAWDLMREPAWIATLRFDEAEDDEFFVRADLERTYGELEALGCGPTLALREKGFVAEIRLRAPTAADAEQVIGDLWTIGCPVVCGPNTVVEPDTARDSASPTD